MKKLFGILSIFLVFFISFSIVAFVRYNFDIKHFKENGDVINFIVEPGENVSKVGYKLKNEGLISSKTSFEIYARLNSLNSIKAGKYEISSSMTIPEILKLLNEGQQVTKTFNVMFLPGGTVKMAKQTLISAGFSENEVDHALEFDYTNEFPQLFADKPSDTDLEGFLWGETHTFEKDIDVKDIIRRFLGDFQQKVISLNLEEKFKEQGLNLYEGITLASIVQKETLDNPEDQKMVAGVFFNRMRSGMNLGSDVTYQYIADKLGIRRDYNLQNPYNLRIHTGLTPTPIATPGLSALNAVANPIASPYLFFLSGDDDKTYFATTDEEHTQNIKNYCQQKCQII